MKLKRRCLDLKMRNIFKLILIIIFIFSFNESKANTLFESLSLAYSVNPKLNAERASARASKEDKRESASEFLPSVTVSGYVSEQENTNPGEDTNFRPSEQSITIEQVTNAKDDLKAIVDK